MSNPNLIELAAEIADHIVKTQYKNELKLYPDAIIFEDKNGDIRYRPVVQEVFNEHYDFVYNLLESGNLKVKNELETML